MRATRRLAFVLAAAQLSGCANLQTVQYQNGAPLPKSALPYALQKTSITLNSTYVLSSCNSKDGIKFTTTSSLTTTATADDNMRFYIDYGSMQSAFKDTNVTLDLYSNGTLKDIDTSGTNQILQTAAAGLGAVLTGVVAIEGGAGDNAAAKPVDYCKKDIKDDLTELSSAQKDQKANQLHLDADNKALNAATGDQIKALQAKVQGDAAKLADDTDRVTKATAKLTLTTSQIFNPFKRDFIDAAEWTADITPALACNTDADKARCASRDKAAAHLNPITGINLTAAQSGVFNAGRQLTVPYAVDFQPLLNQWFDDQGGLTNFTLSPDYGSKLAVTISSPLSAVDDRASLASNQSNPIKGLPIRLPVSAHLQMCRIYTVAGKFYNECDPSRATLVRNQGVYSLDVLLPQLGSPVILTLQGSPIQLSKLTVAMNSDGSISNITTADSSTTTQIFNSISSAFTTASTQQNAIITAKAAALTAQNGTVNANAAMLTAQNGATAANAQVTTANNGLVSANAAMLTAQNGTVSANASMLSTQTTANAAQIQTNDNILKYQLDCIAQAKAISQAGGVPSAQCQ